MTCDQQNEMLRFVWRNESFRFRGFGRVRVRNETDGRPMGDGVGRSGGSSCTKALCGRHSQASCLKERCAASRLEGRSEATNAFVAAMERSPRQAQGRFSRQPGGASERGLGNSKARKKLRGSALKSLKQLVRVNLCATSTEGSQADDSR
jgi:hypothetical protein